MVRPRPDLIVNIEWSSVNKKRNATVHQSGDDFYNRMSRNTTGRDGIAYLEGLVDDRDEYTRPGMRSSNKPPRTTTNIANSVERSEEAIKVLKVVRDTSAETELVLVALATTGGAGLVSGNAVLLTATEGATGGAAGTPTYPGLCRQGRHQVAGYWQYRERCGRRLHRAGN